MPSILTLPARAVGSRRAMRTAGLLDAALAAVAARGPRRRTGRRHVLLSAPGAGNIGDQAMLESYLAHCAGEVTVVCRSAVDVGVPRHERARVRVVELPGLVYGMPHTRIRDAWAFARLLRGAATYSVVGADIMDGAYNLRASVQRASTLRMASTMGVDARVLGFSWNGAPAEDARAALARASRRAAVLLRDPVSHRRALDTGLLGAELVADTVFLLDASTEVTEHHRWMTSEQQRGRRLALVNASGLIGRSLPQEAEYELVVRHLVARGFSVLLVPHVSKPGTDDVQECRAVLDAVDDPSVRLVDSLLAPGVVKSLAQQTELVVTGRMHLAILALGSGVPAITLATQGKVEGVLGALGVGHLVVEPTTGFGARVVHAVDAVLADPSAVTDVIAAHLPEVRTRSARNFTGLDHPA